MLLRKPKLTYLNLAAGCGWTALAGSGLLLGAIKEGGVYLLCAFLGFGLAGLIFCGCAAVERLGSPPGSR
ncbi:MAG TPA: hypothetical protein VGE74_02315 [Gemmata sp.]